MRRRYATNLRCRGCLTAIRPLLDSEPRIRSWSADVSHPDKLLTIDGEISEREVNELLSPTGYRLTGERPATDERATNGGATDGESYYPLILIVAYIFGTAVLIELSSPPADMKRAMENFMAGFFLVFSFFKLLNLSAFADAFAGYDLLARRSRTYALAYPFLELALGAAYVTRSAPTATNWATLIVMGVGAAGVARSLWHRQAIRCACLGTVFRLPMSMVTLAEDVSMAAMAAIMLAIG